MRMHSRRALRLTLALAATAATGAALTAQAAAATPQISAFGSGGHIEDNSTYLAGYGVTEPGISRASMVFRVPTMTCGADTEGTAEGIGNEQSVGSPTLLAIVFDACVGGSPLHTIQATAGGNSQFGNAAEGDRIKVSMVQTRNRVKSTVTDVTSATTVSATGTPTPDNSITFGSFPLFSGGQLPVADFGTVRMQQPTLENSDLSAWSPTKLNRRTGSTTQILTTAFNGGTSGAFSLIFKNH